MFQVTQFHLVCLHSRLIANGQLNWLDLSLMGIIGKSTNVKSFPYVAAILTRDDIENDYDIMCACIIISKRHALTAAHCIEMLEVYEVHHCKIRSGSIFWHDGGALHDIVSVVKHKRFGENFMENDIGVVSVNPAFRKKQIIAVAGPHYALMDGSYINVIGWGETDPERTLFMPAGQLYSVTVRILNKTECMNMINAYRTERNTPTPTLMVDDSQFCTKAMEGGKDACVYDSGGPAVQGNVLVGIISFGGPVCASKNLPGIYTNLGNLHKWLLELNKKLYSQIKFVD